MKLDQPSFRRLLQIGASLSALGAAAFTWTSCVLAQTTTGEPPAAGASVTGGASVTDAAHGATSVPNGGGSSIDSAQGAPAVEQIVVTASRVNRKGFEAPTPTTVVGGTELLLGARPNIAAVLADLPEVKDTYNTTNTARSAVLSGEQVVDLRGIGPTRTLVLLNGHRFIGDNDLNTVPLDLVKRVEVVTGGASADWGSGAIAGVVNIILDDKLDGGVISGASGISTHGDGDEYRAAGAYGGKFANDRGHFMVDAEWYDNNGIYPLTSRTNVGGAAVLANPAYAPGNGQHAFVIARNVGPTNLSEGGLVTSGPLKGESFNPDGTTSPFNYGAFAGSSLSVGGSEPSGDSFAYLSVPVERVNLYGRATYDLSNRITLSTDIRYTDVYNHYNFAPDVNFGTNINVQNAFLPAAVRSQMVADGITNFNLGRNNDDFEFRDYDYSRQDLQATFGAQGSFGKSWTWDAYYTHGQRTVQEVFNHQRITANFNLAADSLISPTTGQPICRIALSVPSTNCVPIDLFGYGNVSAAAANYVNGSSLLRTLQRLDDGAVNLRGSPFSVWAGPVSIATGLEVRHEGIHTIDDDPISLMNGFTTVNPKGFDGSFTAEEGYVETVVPILRDAPLLQALDFNGAARVSDYTKSGTVWAWKAGVTDQVLHDFRLRLVRSRDTRTASLTEQFTHGTQSTGTISDPETRTQYTVTQFNGGNPNLLPELSDTTTFGFTYAPFWLPGFDLSIDHYNINIKRAITTLSAQDIVTRCFNGNTSLCDLITRGGTGTITSIQSTYINLSNYTTDGTDLEASYTFPLRKIWSEGPGSIRFRALVNNTDSLVTNDGKTRVQYAGTVGNGPSFGSPKWQENFEVVYVVDLTTLSLRARNIGGGTFNPLMDIANNKVTGRTYVDLTFEQGFSLLGRLGFTIYGNINNVFDKEPPVDPNPQYYDLIGRYVELGVKARF